MGLEKLGYLLVGVAFLGGAVCFFLGGRLGKDWPRKIGLFVASFAVVAFIIWGLHVGGVRDYVVAAKREIVIPAPGEPVAHGFAEDPKAMVEEMKQELEKARETCRAYGWKWEEL